MGAEIKRCIGVAMTIAGSKKHLKVCNGHPNNFPSVDVINSIRPDSPEFRNDYGYICYIALYAFASQYCSQRFVLDAASGFGFGSTLLADEASQVVGIDIDFESLSVAAQRYRKKISNLGSIITDKQSSAEPLTAQFYPDTNAYQINFTEGMLPGGGLRDRHRGRRWLGRDIDLD
jgi:SAM-dependent methyltransferase